MPRESVPRSGRIPKEVGVLLTGSDADGKVFAEETRTVMLSRYGAEVVSRHTLYPEQEMILCRLDMHKEAEVRIVGKIGFQSRSYTYGVAFLDPNIIFWDVEFPPLTELEKAARRCLLECSRCKNREIVEHGDIERQVFAINDGIVRHCERCGCSTAWIRAADDADDKWVSPESEHEPEQAAFQAPPAESEIPMPAVQPRNKRKHVRANVNFTACIRRPGFDDDVVICEDMSRGGFCFRSSKRYHVNSFIEVAVPYSAGAPSIFVPAEIVYVLDLPEKGLFRCGAAYNRTPWGAFAVERDV